VNDSEKTSADDSGAAEAALTLTGYSPKPDVSREPPPDGMGRMWESTVPTKDTALMDLVELSENLRSAQRPEVGKAFTSLGYVLVGGAVGAAISEEAVSNKWVLVAGIAGCLCIFFGIVLWIERDYTMSGIRQKLDAHLDTIQDQQTVERLRSIYCKNDDSFVARTRRRLRRRFKSSNV
jgi:hypothetical protein